MNREKIAFALMTPADLSLGLVNKALKATGIKDLAGDKVWEAGCIVIRAMLKKNNKLATLCTENVPTTGGVLLASNHQSWDDAQAIAVTCPRRVHFMSKYEFSQWPVMRQFIDLADQPYIRRGGDQEGLKHAIALLEQSRVLCIFPEGTIPGEEEIMRHEVEPRTGLLRGHTGAIRLAIGGRVPIVPVGVSGTGAAFPPEIYPRLEVLEPPGNAPITVRYGEPISYEAYHGKQVSKEELRRLTDELMLKITALVDHSQDYIPTKVPIEPLPRYERVGVLLLHGFTSSVKTVTGLVPYLDEDRLPYAIPVLRGHGTVFTDLSGVTANDWYADAEEALLDLAGRVDKVIVVGLSMGGLVALNLGMRHPDKIAGIVTWAAALRFANPLSRLTGPLSKVVKTFPSPEAFNDKSLKKNAENYTKFTTDSFGSLYDYAKATEARLAEQLKVPLCVLQSKKDQVVSPIAANIIYHDVSSPYREIHWFKESGHEMGQDLEAAGVFDITRQFIRKFLKR